MNASDSLVWTEIFRDTLVNLDLMFAIRGYATIPPNNVLPVFAVRVESFTEGRWSPTLLFGFVDGDLGPTNSYVRLAFPTIGTGFFQAGVSCGMVPDDAYPGWPLATVPPRVAICGESGGSFTGSYSVHVACRCEK